jgi:hypothetical protein
LYNRAASANGTSSSSATALENGTSAADLLPSAGGTPYVPNPQKPRVQKSKEKIVYTANAKKPMSSKKKALRASNVHFASNSNGPDAAASGAADGGGGGGEWHPEVLHPTSTYADLGGIEAILQEIHELIEYPLAHPEIYRHLGIQPPRGVLLHGPPGCGQCTHRIEEGAQRTRANET